MAIKMGGFIRGIPGATAPRPTSPEEFRPTSSESIIEAKEKEALDRLLSPARLAARTSRDRLRQRQGVFGAQAAEAGRRTTMLTELADMGNINLIGAGLGKSLLGQ
jgi:hypothetical protein